MVNKVTLLQICNRFNVALCYDDLTAWVTTINKRDQRCHWLKKKRRLRSGSHRETKNLPGGTDTSWQREGGDKKREERQEEKETGSRWNDGEEGKARAHEGLKECCTCKHAESTGTWHGALDTNTQILKQWETKPRDAIRAPAAWCVDLVIIWSKPLLKPVEYFQRGIKWCCELENEPLHHLNPEESL